MLTNTRLEMLAIFVIIASGCAEQETVVFSNTTPNFESASSVEEVRTQIVEGIPEAGGSTSRENGHESL